MNPATLFLALVVPALSATAVWAENVEIHAIDVLDNIQEGYCIDISGGQGPQADPDDGLQGHTCYSPSGEVFVDQAFDSTRFPEGIFYMPEFDVCMQAATMQAGAALSLGTCDGSDAQRFHFAGEGAISPVAGTTLCLTLGDETRFGRSQQNQIKSLTLEDCSEELAEHQTWAYRTADR